MGFLKNFFGGKSIFSYSKKGFLKDVGRMSEHLDTMTVSEIGQKLNLEIAKEDRTVEEQIGKEYYKLKNALNEEQAILTDNILNKINERKSVLRRWYTEVSSGAFHKDVEHLKERITRVIQGLSKIHLTLEKFNEDNKKNKINKKQLLNDLDSATSEWKKLNLEQEGIFEKHGENNSVMGREYNKNKRSIDDLYKKIKKLRNKIEKSPEVITRGNQIKKNIDIILPSITHSVDLLINTVSTPFYEVSTPALKTYVDEMKDAFFSLEKVRKKLMEERLEIMKLAMHDKELINELKDLKNAQAY